MAVALASGLTRGADHGTDRCPQLIRERDDYRVLVMSGILVPGFSVIGQLASDGAIELVQLDIDTELNW